MQKEKEEGNWKKRIIRKPKKITQKYEKMT